MIPMRQGGLMPIEIKDEKDFNEKIKNEGFVVIQCSAQWCGPCKTQTIILTELKIEGVEFYKLDIEKFNVISEYFNIKSIPTLLLFENGEWLDSHSGVMRENEIKEWILNET